MTTAILIATALRSMVIALLAVVAGSLFRGARPGIRSLIWNSALVACLIVPLAAAVAPQLTVYVPTGFFPGILSRTASTAEARPATLERESSPPGTSEPTNQNLDGDSTILFYVWAAGLLLVATRFASQVVRARHFARSATPFTELTLENAVADARRQLGIRRRVDVLKSSQIDIPLVTGILRPTILMPASASEWTDADLRIVLLHELAHVRRADVFTRAVAMLACAIHWFNPLVWMLSRRATSDAELAADDLVLRTGVRPSTYADALLNIAGSVFRLPAAQPSMPLARRAGLADRVHFILLENGPRTDASRQTAVAVVAGSATLAMLAACVTLAATPSTNAVASAPMPAASALSTVPTTDALWVEDATDGLIRALADASPQVRGGAARSLGRLRAQRARPALLALTRDADKNVRYEADQALIALDRTN